MWQTLSIGVKKLRQVKEIAFSKAFLAYVFDNSMYIPYFSSFLLFTSGFGAIQAVDNLILQNNSQFNERQLHLSPKRKPSRCSFVP